MAETTQAPAAQAAPVQPDAGAVETGGAQQATQTQPQPAKPAPFAEFTDAKSFEKRMDREARSRMNAAAKAAGFDDWEHMQAEVGARQPAKDGKAAGKASDAQPDTHEADRLRMALTIGAQLNLPAALIGRLQGSTPEEMEADAKTLMALIGTGQAGQAPGQPGIAVPRGNAQPTTFTRAQMADAKFVREHAEDIRKAAREGRIVNS